jgi:DNA-binding response OmpR family regulator
MPESATILLVDDEESIQKLLTYPLEHEGFHVVQARDGEEALQRFEENAVDLVILDKVLGLELGADDYITKPFSIREFRSRVRAALRRAQLPPASARSDAIEVEGVSINLAKRTVEVAGELVQLTYLEFELLRTLAGNPGRVYSRQALLEALWGGSDYRDPRTIDVHVRHLREKIEADPSEPHYLFTVRGVGYRFREVT